MAHPSWNESYASGHLPWDTGQPEPLLVEFVTSDAIKPSPTLEIGSGTGTNAIWMAERGFDVLGVDISPLAVERANAKIEGPALHCRGCFHVFDESAERQQFAARVANALAPGGFWLSIIGSTEGSPREVGPPRRSAREVAVAIEPSLEIVELRSADFRGTGAKAWFCLSRKRTVPAQPSTLHD